ncbi:FKBP-type peptidyl-prolyl cis-trans isomerase [Breznakiellaceae bacterium SP9]
MKKVLVCVTVFLLCGAFSVSAEGIKEKFRANQATANEKRDMSYAFGVALGGDLKELSITFDYDSFAAGLRDELEGGEKRISPDEAVRIVRLAFSAALTEQRANSAQQERDFLLENGKQSGIMTTESGLQYEILVEAEGPKPLPENVVKVHYEGTLLDGTVFDSTGDRTIDIPLSQVIPGWAEGVQLMSIGAKYRFYIPSALAYGERGGGDVIPPYSTLVFTIELADILEDTGDYNSYYDDYDDYDDEESYPELELELELDE